MSIQKTSKGLVGAGILSAVAASLCCITPVLALIAGSSGMASAFSWLEPARPYLIGITVLVLGFAWYQKLQPQKEIECDCEEDEKKPFMQTKLFLGLVTGFAAIMLAFPYYSHIFYGSNSSNVVVVEPANVQQADFNITGMTCESCSEHIEHAVAQLPGFIQAESSYEEGTATVRFDKSKTGIDDVVAAINETGYKVADYKLAENNH